MNSRYNLLQVNFIGLFPCLSELEVPLYYRFDREQYCSAVSTWHIAWMLRFSSESHIFIISQSAIEEMVAPSCSSGLVDEAKELAALVRIVPTGLVVVHFLICDIFSFSFCLRLNLRESFVPDSSLWQ